MNLRHIKNGVLILGIGAALTWSGAARAQSGDALLNKLVDKGVLTQREANQLREDMDKESAQTVETYNKVKVASWIDQMMWSGDLRLRGEYFEFEKDINGFGKPGNPDRTRFRYRLRLGMEMPLHDWAKVNVRLASGEAAPGDPVSVNQTFNNTWQKKPINIDVASVTLQPPSWDFITVSAGKMDIPIWQPKFNSPMVYDFDDTPEGVAEQLQFRFGDKQQYRIFGQFGQFVAKELSKDSNDAFVFDFQGGAEAKFGNDPKNPKLRITGAGGYFMTHNIANATTNGFMAVGDSPNLGNTTRLYPLKGTTNTLFFADYNVLYGRSELAWNISDTPFLGTPPIVTVSGEYDVNLNGAFDKLTGSASGAVSNLNQTTGWTAQVVFGDARKRGQWQVAYQYKYLEADAVWDAITDSDWGNGGTDRKGHVVKAIYNVRDWWQLGFAAFMTEKISSRPNSGHNTVGVAGEDELRVQVDSVFKF